MTDSNKDELSVPIVSALALVVSTADSDTEVIRPRASTMIVGMLLAEPYVPSTTPDAGSCAAFNVPDVIALALIPEEGSADAGKDPVVIELAFNPERGRTFEEMSPVVMEDALRP